MTNLAKFYWSLWIGGWTGVYVICYLFSPLAEYGCIWITFVALPIFFNGGALRKDFFPQIVSSWLGVAWGLIMLFFANVFAGIGPVFSMALSVAVFTVASCMMMCFENKHLINMVPAAFGGISTCFSQGGSNWWVVGITLTLGVCLGLLCNEGGPLCVKWASKGKTAAEEAAE